MGYIIGDDEGWAVRRDGVILLRTASDTRRQAIMNGLVLLFEGDIQTINNTATSILEHLWSHIEAVNEGSLELVRCKAIEV